MERCKKAAGKYESNVTATSKQNSLEDPLRLDAGKNNKYVVTATCLNWEVAYPISNLLSGGGILPSSNVWGIVGKNVTALLAIETTELELKIPGLADDSKIHVVIWDNKKNKKSEKTVTYHAPFKQMLKEYDLILIDAVK